MKSRNWMGLIWRINSNKDVWAKIWGDGECAVTKGGAAVKFNFFNLILKFFSLLRKNNLDFGYRSLLVRLKTGYNKNIK